jgi:hypothetical protein
MSGDIAQDDMDTPKEDEEGIEMNRRYLWTNPHTGKPQLVQVIRRAGKHGKRNLYEVAAGPDVDDEHFEAEADELQKVGHHQAFHDKRLRL